MDINCTLLLNLCAKIDKKVAIYECTGKKTKYFVFSKRCCIFAASRTVEETKAWVTKTLNEHPPLRVEYFEIVDATSLQPIRSWDETAGAVGCAAVYCGDVRLIDNIKY